MFNDLVMSFPVLRQDSGDFLEEVVYRVDAEQSTDTLTITHRLSGHSFIRRFIEEEKANFSVLMLYRDSAERENHVCDMDRIICNENEITATQEIPKRFSYAPEIMPSIVCLKDVELTVNNISSGLTDFWSQDEQFRIPGYARIALHPKLKFTAGSLSCLMRVVCDDKLEPGLMQVDVNEHAGEGEIPVTLSCAQDVFDTLKGITRADPNNAVDMAKHAMVTQALCAVYGYMKNLSDDCELGGVLQAHLELLERKCGGWRDENFNPSLVATTMHPYAIKALQGRESDGSV